MKSQESSLDAELAPGRANPVLNVTAASRAGAVAPAAAARRVVARVPLPPGGGSNELLNVDVASLTQVERMQPGWCIRVGYPDPVPGDTTWLLFNLICEVTFTVGGVVQSIEVDAFPGFTMHVVADQVSARLKWAVGGAGRASDAVAVVHVGRGLCPTTATRSVMLWAEVPATDLIPLYATRWGLWHSNGSLTGDASKSLVFRCNGQQLNAWGNDDIEAIANGLAFPRLPPGANVWEWTTAYQADFRLSFFFGEAFG